MIGRRGERLFVWTGGAMFVLSLLLTTWWYAVFLGADRPAFGWAPFIVDACLFSVFAVHHSLFARAGIKSAIARTIPGRLLRSTYVWAASVLLMLVCLLWQPIGGDLYNDAGWPAVIHAIVQMAGVVLIAQSVRAIDALELAGIRVPGPPSSVGEAVPRSGLQVTGPYRLVRHPLYLGWMLVVFGAAHLTMDRLAFAAISSLYLVVAIPWEERSLTREFGAEYGQYQEQVRWRVLPGVY